MNTSSLSGWGPGESRYRSSSSIVFKLQRVRNASRVGKPTQYCVFRLNCQRHGPPKSVRRCNPDVLAPYDGVRGGNLPTSIKSDVIFTRSEYGSHRPSGLTEIPQQSSAVGSTVPTWLSTRRF